MRGRYSGALVLLAGALALSAPALAGNPHGTPPGKTNVNVRAGAGVSAGAHVKGSVKAHAGINAGVRAHGHGAAGVASTTSTGAGVSAGAHVKGSVKAHAGITAGVRAHGHGAAGARSTIAGAATALSPSASAKVYGNGVTAGQVALRSGMSGATLYAVGSSGAHKVLCDRQLIDVHALKAHLHVCAGATLGLSAGTGVTTTAGLTTSAPATRAKVYGNGMTAAQLALQAGLGGALLFAPGSSQAHLALCGAHMVDVHALKAHTSACAAGAGTTVSPTGASLTGTAGTAMHTTAAAGATTQSSTTLAAGANVKNSGTAGAKNGGTTGGVLGVTASAPQHPTGAVLGATASGGTLPFTGLALGLPIGLALMLLVSGLGMRYATRPER